MSALTDLQDSVAALRSKVDERLAFDTDLGVKLDQALAAAQASADDSAQLVALKAEVDALASRLAVLAPATAPAV